MCSVQSAPRNVHAAAECASAVLIPQHWNSKQPRPVKVLGRTTHPRPVCMALEETDTVTASSSFTDGLSVMVRLVCTLSKRSSTPEHHTGRTRIHSILTVTRSLSEHQIWNIPTPKRILADQNGLTGRQTKTYQLCGLSI